jgi:PKD repeat protein
MKRFRARHGIISALLLIVSITPILLAGPLTVPVYGGEPTDDSTMILTCVGLIPSTPNCVSDALAPFETLVHDVDSSGTFSSGDTVIVGTIPVTGQALTDEPKIRYRDSNNDSVWTPATPEPVFYDQDGNLTTAGDRVSLIGTRTISTTLIKDDPDIRFVDTSGNGGLDGVIRITARLENLGGTHLDGTQEDVDGIQVIYTFDPAILAVMRASYPSGTFLPGGSQFKSAVGTHCTRSGGSPLDTTVVDESAGQASASHACTQGPPRDVDVGIGCDPLTTTTGVCPGVDTDGDGSGDVPLQNADVTNLQYMITGRAAFTITHVRTATTGSEITDIDGTTPTDIPLQLVNAEFDNMRGPGNPPTARFFFRPAKGTVGQPIIFDGTNSTDDGLIVSYFWSFGDGTAASGPVVSHSYNSSGTFPVSLTVADNEGGEGDEIQLVPVNPSSGNQSPVAFFAPSTPKAVVGQPVTFNGNYSYDIDGRIVGYSWTFGDGGNATGPTVSHTYPSTGTYTVTLTVTDDGGAMGAYSQTIMVNPAVDYQPGVNVGDYALYSFSGNGTGIPDINAASFNVTRVVGTNVTLFTTVLFANGTSSSMELTVDIRSFYSSGLLLTAANLTAGDQIWVDAPYKVNGTVVGFFAGSDRLTTLLFVSQFGGGFTAQWDQATGVLVYYFASFGDPNLFFQILIVETNIWGPGPGPNQPPTARFSVTPAKANVGQPVTFDGRASSDNDGIIVRYHWDFGDGTNSSFSASVLSHAYSSPGNYTVTLTVTDDDGATDVETHVIIVNPVVQKRPPVAIFFYEPQNPIVGQTLRFDASSSFDPDGFIQSYRWSFGDGTTILDGSVFFYSYSRPGTFNVTLIVTDNQSLSSSTSAVVVVRTRPQHDVGVDFAYLSPTDRLVAGQLATVTVIAVNRGTSDENMAVTAFYNGVPIGSVTTFISGSQFYPNYAYVTIFWDTSTVPPGDYVITASAHIPLDEDPSNDVFTAGLVAILPPPTLTLSHDRASVGTKVVVTGDGFPEAPFPQGFPRPVLVSFDNQFVGYVFAMGDGFQFTFNVPHAQPGLHTINVLDVLAFLRVSTSITVIDASAIELDLEVGDFYFEGDTALATLLVLKNGQRIDPTTIHATLTLPNGSTQTLEVRKAQGTTGLYRIEISIPSRNSVGTYTVNVETSYQTDLVSSEGQAVNVFTVNTAWLSPRRIQTLSIGGSAIAGIIALAVVIKTGHLGLRRKKDPSKAANIMTQTNNTIEENSTR